MIRTALLILATACAVFAGDAGRIRIAAANLTSGNHQSYSPDNANHSNPEGAGARILKGLKPDVVLIQEFNTTIPVRQWVNQTLGTDYKIVREDGPGIPNGIITRLPVIESGEWDDPAMDNRDFVWAKVALPDGSRAWLVSVHLSAKKPATRAAQAAALKGFLAGRVAPGERIVIGGDFNTRSLDEACLGVLGAIVAVPGNPPVDAFGNPNTNAPRSRPYDGVFVDAGLSALEKPVNIAGRLFPNGLVFDSRIFEPLDAVSPVQASDSGVQGMQHMAVVRDFDFTE